MSDLPVPETREVFLPSAGVPRATVHKYSHTEEVPFIDPSGKPDGTALAFVFECAETGEKRRWGNVP